VFFDLLRRAFCLTVFFLPCSAPWISGLRRCRPLRRPLNKRKCKHGQTFFAPDPRCTKRQRYCATLTCRQASKAASQHRWVQKPGNRDYFTGPTHVERVRQWRRAHPGYWRHPGARAPHALQDDLTPQGPHKQPLDEGLTPYALHDVFFMQPPMVVGLIAHLTGLSFPDDIAMTARRLQQLGRDILCGSPHLIGGIQDAHTSHRVGQTPHRPQTVQLGGSAAGP
jgi:hypothetical protein